MRESDRSQTQIILDLNAYKDDLEQENWDVKEVLDKERQTYREAARRLNFLEGYYAAHPRNPITRAHIYRRLSRPEKLTHNQVREIRKIFTVLRPIATQSRPGKIMVRQGLRIELALKRRRFGSDHSFDPEVESLGKL